MHTVIASCVIGSLSCQNIGYNVLGEMAEWSMAPDLKSGSPSRGSWVRIPLSPPFDSQAPAGHLLAHGKPRVLFASEANDSERSGDLLENPFCVQRNIYWHHQSRGVEEPLAASRFVPNPPVTSPAVMYFPAICQLTLHASSRPHEAIRYIPSLIQAAAYTPSHSL